MEFLRRITLSVVVMAIAACDRRQEAKGLTEEISKELPAKLSWQAATSKATKAFAAATVVRQAAGIDDSDPTSENGVIRSAADRARIPEYLRLKQYYLADEKSAIGTVLEVPKLREMEEELAKTEENAAVLRRRMKEMREAKKVNDTDPDSSSGQASDNSEANHPDRGKAALEEYVSLKRDYLATTVLVRAMRRAYEEEKRGEGFSSPATTPPSSTGAGSTLQVPR